MVPLNKVIINNNVSIYMAHISSLGLLEAPVSWSLDLFICVLLFSFLRRYIAYWAVYGWYVIIGHELQPPTVHPPHLHLTHTKLFLNFDMSKTWNEILTTKKRNELYIFTPYGGYPQTCLKIRGRVTQTPVVDVLVDQSALAIPYNS